ncbi:MAG: hypothetical protein ACK4SY_09745 [Pyrobaculum sp.]
MQIQDANKLLTYENAALFIRWLDAIRAVNSEVSVQFKESGLYVNILDPTHTLHLETHFDKRWFREYRKAVDHIDADLDALLRELGRGSRYESISVVAEGGRYYVVMGGKTVEIKPGHPGEGIEVRSEVVARFKVDVLKLKRFVDAADHLSDIGYDAIRIEVGDGVTLRMQIDGGELYKRFDVESEGSASAMYSVDLIKLPLDSIYKLFNRDTNVVCAIRRGRVMSIHAEGHGIRLSYNIAPRVE